MNAILLLTVVLLLFMKRGYCSRGVVLRGYCLGHLVRGVMAWNPLRDWLIEGVSALPTALCLRRRNAAPRRHAISTTKPRIILHNLSLIGEPLHHDPAECLEL